MLFLHRANGRSCIYLILPESEPSSAKPYKTQQIYFRWIIVSHKAFGRNGTRRQSQLGNCCKYAHSSFVELQLNSLQVHITRLQYLQCVFYVFYVTFDVFELIQNQTLFTNTELLKLGSDIQYKIILKCPKRHCCLNVENYHYMQYIHHYLESFRYMMKIVTEFGKF